MDEDECSVCGEVYRTTDLGVSWDEGEALIRQNNRAGLVAGSDRLRQWMVLAGSTGCQCQRAVPAGGIIWWCW